jgi:hypothetical protein
MLQQNHIIEFHVRAILPLGETKAGNPNFRFEDIQNDLDYIYVRPDVIQRALPWDSGVLIPPQLDNLDMCWVVSAQRGQTLKVNPERKAMGMAEKFHIAQERSATRIKQLQFIQNKRDEQGLGIKLKEERRAARRELKEAGILKTFRQ